VKFIPAELPGVYLIEWNLLQDNRGFFARSFCQREFEAHGLKCHFPQCNTSWNKEKGTLRGMHYQLAPNAEVKVVRCTRGAIHDVVIDLRRESPTYCRWMAVELSANDHRMLYVPEGFAHGYQTLTPDTETFYMVSEFYAPNAERAVRWNDPTFAIRWPLPNPILSAKDAAHPDFVR
jgi:dTDP-4-dehydrorhamnose 3,5-epimerase